MRILTRIADEIRHTRAVYRNHNRLIEAQAEYDNDENPANRAVIAEHAAFVVEHQIEYLAASQLARMVTAFPPDVLRESVADWNARAEQAWTEAAANAGR